MRARYLLALAALMVACPALLQAQESVADAARKAREKKATAAKARKTFTNDELPAKGTVSVVGTEAGPEAQGQAGVTPGTALNEADWRKRFSEAREKLANSEKDLQLLERELQVMNVQYYPDPQKALEQETRRSDINEQRRKIEEKKNAVAASRQALEDLERELRAAGGPPGWARP